LKKKLRLKLRAILSRAEAGTAIKALEVAEQHGCPLGVGGLVAFCQTDRKTRERYQEATRARREMESNAGGAR
jgi:hypothetical protein